MEPFEVGKNFSANTVPTLVIGAQNDANPVATPGSGISAVQGKCPLG